MSSRACWLAHQRMRSRSPGRLSSLTWVLLGVGEGDVDEADGFVGVGARCSGAGAGDAGDGDAERCAGADADAFGEGARYFGGDGAFGRDEFGGNVGEGGFEGVAVDDCAAEEVARAAGDGGEALGEETAGAAFGGGESEVAKAEVEEHDLFERFAVRGEDGVFHLGFDLFDEFVDAGLGFGQGGFGAEEVELDLAGAGEDGGLDIGVLLVDGSGAGVDVRLGDERHAEECVWRDGEREGRRRGAASPRCRRAA